MNLFRALTTLIFTTFLSLSYAFPTYELHKTTVADFSALQKSQWIKEAPYDQACSFVALAEAEKSQNQWALHLKNTRFDSVEAIAWGSINENRLTVNHCYVEENDLATTKSFFLLLAQEASRIKISLISLKLGKKQSPSQHEIEIFQACGFKGSVTHMTTNPQTIITHCSAE